MAYVVERRDALTPLQSLVTSFAASLSSCEERLAAHIVYLDEQDSPTTATREDAA